MTTLDELDAKLAKAKEHAQDCMPISSTRLLCEVVEGILERLRRGESCLPDDVVRGLARGVWKKP